MDTAKLMQQVKLAISRGNWNYLKSVLRSQTPEFCGQALFFAIEKSVNDTKQRRRRSPPSTYSNECTAHENKGLVQLFIDYGADVNAIVTEESNNYRGYSTFGYACQLANADIVKLLLDSKADLTLKDNNGLLPVQLALSSKNKEVTDIFWELGVNKEDVNVLGLLIHAVKGHQEENVKKLLEMGADVGAVNKHNNTALHVAVINKNLKFTQLLVDNGADVNKVGNRNKTALEWAVLKQQVDIVKYLLDNGADVHLGADYPLQAAITKDESESCEEIVKLLLEHGADIAKQNRRLTPVDKAASVGNAGALKLLLELGAECNSDNLMSYAIHGGNIKCVENLLDHGLEAIRPYLHIAVSIGREEMVKLFLERGVAPDDDFILFSAISRKFASIVKILLEHGMNAKARIHSRAQIGWAVSVGTREIVKLLLDFGADVNQTTTEYAVGRVPLHDAADRGDEAIFKLLLERGADVNAIFSNKTPLTILIDNGRVELAKIVVTQMVLMESRGLKVHEKNWSDVRASDEVVEWKNECENELETMRNEKFDDSSLSVFDIFQSNDDLQLAGWARNENVVKALKSDEILKKFPIYGHLLVENFEKGVLKNKDFQLVKRFAAYLSDRDHDQLPELPLPFVCQVFDYLNYDDVAVLRNLSA